MPRTSESTTSKLLRLIDELTPDQLVMAQDILNHAMKKSGVTATAPKKRGRKKKGETPNDGTGT